MGIVLGFALLLSGLAAWVGVSRSWVTVPIVGTAVFSFIPAGIGFILTAIGAGLDLPALTYTGIAALGAGGLLSIWRPKWLQPGWYRELPYDVRFAPPARTSIRTGGGPVWIDQVSPLLRQSRATYLDDGLPVRVLGIVTSSHAGHLSLYPDTLLFRQGRLDTYLRGAKFQTVIPLAEIELIQVVPADMAKVLTSVTAGGLQSWRTHLRIKTESNDYLFLVPHPQDWARALENASGSSL